ncbi:hypothetical protein [Neptunomonas antarctica]|uniref:Uncharacterized protein n=1 Tax=Neptunomonas antarctica TaxID=619304 RepID=A0A1N7LSA4_9GAMM|nr:hypothetical protein [Neptunomonas antarctica]SIS76745.1 hypothetical protein SAMN05421760_104291 [Neptunomonas antarctica]
MDMLAIIIIVIATISAIGFKIYLFKRIRRWMDQDLIKVLAEGDADKKIFLTQMHLQLISAKTPRNKLHEALTEHAKHYSTTLK